MQANKQTNLCQSSSTLSVAARPILHITFSTLLKVKPQENARRWREGYEADANTSLSRSRGSDAMTLDASSH